MAFKDGYSSLDKSPRSSFTKAPTSPSSPSLIKPPTSSISSLTNDQLHDRHDPYSDKFHSSHPKSYRSKKRTNLGGGFQVKSNLSNSKSPQKFENKRKSSIFNHDENSPSSSSSPSRKKRPLIYQKKKFDDWVDDGDRLKGKGRPAIPISDNDDNDSDDDDDFGIIDINKLSSIPSIPASQPINKKKQTGKNSKSSTDSPVIKNTNEQKDDDDEDHKDQDLFASTVLGKDGNILSNLHKNKHEKIDTIKQKFSHYNLPSPPTSRKLLRARVMKHLDLVPEILRGKAESRYYTRARNQAKKSPHQTMSKDEKWHIRWNDYVGGYYGLDRQHFINLVILSKWRKLITSHESKSSVIRYWTPNDFSAYVLASEIIIRLIMEDLNCRQSKAEVIMDETTEYGTVVTDSIPLDQDLDNGELFGKESKKFMKNIDDEADNDNVNTSIRKEKLHSDDLLTSIFNDDDSD